MTTQATEYATDALDDIEWLLDFIDMAHVESATGQQKRGHVKRSFKEAFPAVYMNPSDPRGEGLVWDSPEVFDAVWPIDHCDIAASRGNISIRRVKTVTPREARGKVKRFAPKMVRMETYVSEDRGSVHAGAELYFGIYPNRTIREITNVEWEHPALIRKEEAIVQLVAGSAMTNYYNWHVVIGAVGSPVKVKLPATPQSAREFLSLRDVPEGMQRRAAIKHWVAEHQRRRETPGEYDVRAHLRGREEFTWGDYEGWVEPSAHDLAKAGGAQ